MTYLAEIWGTPMIDQKSAACIELLVQRYRVLADTLPSPEFWQDWEPPTERLPKPDLTSELANVHHLYASACDRLDERMAQSEHDVAKVRAWQLACVVQTLLFCGTVLLMSRGM